MSTELRTADDLREAQNLATEFMLDTLKCAIFMSMGLGKTGASLQLLSILFNRFAVDMALVVAPLRVARKTWPDEFAVWDYAQDLRYELLWNAAPGEVIHHKGGERRIAHWERKKQELSDAWFDATLSSDDSPRDVARINKFKRQIGTAKRTLEWGYRAARRPADIHIINQDNLAYLVHFWGKNFWPYDLIIYDESSGLRNGKKALRWRSLRLVAQRVKRLVQLTGTPAPNGLLGLWAQVYLLDGGERLGKTMTDYKKEYFDVDYTGYHYTLKPGAADRIFAAIKDICITLQAKDFMDIPPTLYNAVPVVLEPEDWRRYKKLEKDFIVRLLDGKDIVADTAAIVRMKLLQLANGRVYDEEKLTHKVHDAKLTALREYVDELQGETVIIVYWFQHDLAAIRKVLPEAVVFGEHDDTIQDDWNLGLVPVMLMQPREGAHGLNIQFGGRRLLWFGPIDDLELWLQLNERLGGARATGTTFVDTMVVSGTIEEDVMVVQALKDAQQNELFEATKRFIAKC